ncbi:MAG: sugar transferase [Lachnospiraceae bacterium]|jgi:exopolysaccharide biosynthesis polyprenyl glycosylphosphotransferase|nr:sugar transferase [Lachnospiraceae bacterium]
MYQKRKTIEKGMITLVDAACLVISLVLAFQLRYRIFMGISHPGDQIWLLPLMLVILVMANMIFEFSHHFFRQGYLKNLVQVIKLQITVSVALVVLLYLMHQATLLSRLVFGYFIILNTVLTYAGHLLLKQYMMKVFRKSKYSSRLLIVATREKIQDIIWNIVRFNEWNRNLVGIALMDVDAVGQKVEEIPVVANTRNFMEYVIHHDIDEVFIMDSERLHHKTVETWIKELEQMGIIVDMNIDIFDIEVHGKKTLNRVGKYAVVTFARNLFSTKQILAKRMLDVVGSLVGMILLGIATIFIAPAIKMESPGPVFFGQTRIGKNGRRFTFYKFRSMYQDAEERKKELMAKNEVQGLMFKMEDDPRITKVGKFIRKTSIDELPQFWNVLKGDMSLVGTRPPTVDEFEQYEAKHKCRLSMTPGLTGMWQISGRSDIKDFDEVVKLDMQYIDNWTILKDIEILILTVFVVLTGKGSR